MATKFKNLSHYDETTIPNASPYTFAIICSEWHKDITFNLKKGAKSTLIKHGALEKNILEYFVPGAYELCSASNLLLNKRKDIDSLICIASIIQGETRHFEFICQAVSQGIKDISIKHNVPIIFCVLTDNTKQQAIDRSGGKYGNKGVDAAIAAIKMAKFKNSL